MLFCLRHFITHHIFHIGNVYNIPIAIWLVETHPTNAPMVFVKPTSDMQIRISKHVDHTGKVYLPYLHAWSPVIPIHLLYLFFF